jgi:acyl-CoA thioesterase
MTPYVKPDTGRRVFPSRKNQDYAHRDRAAQRGVPLITDAWSTGDVTEADEIARRCADKMYAADRSSRHLGIEISDVAAGRARATMTVAGTMVNGHGIAHGGYVFLLADTAFAFACNTYEIPTVAAAADVVFLAPARSGDRLVADAAERVRYGRSGIYDVTVRRDDGEIIAEFRGNSRALPTAGR